MTLRTLARVTVWLFLLPLAGCTPAARAKAASDAEKSLDKACALRAEQKAMEPDAGAVNQ